MSYTPTTWAAGDTVTAAKLNKLEQGIASGGVLVVHATASDDALTLDKTWQEIYDADAISIVWVEGNDFKNYMTCVRAVARTPLGGGDTEYAVQASVGGDGYSFETNSASGYPSYAINNYPS